jgi:hypothetical protein
MTYELTNADFDEIASAMVVGSKVVQVSIGILSLVDIRSIVKVKQEDESKKENEEVNSFSKRFNTPHLDVASEEWLREQLKEIWEEGDVN